MSASDRIRKQSVTGLVALVQRSSNRTIFTTKTSSLFKHFENVALRTAAGKKKKKAQHSTTEIEQLLAAVFYRESKRHCHRDLWNTVLDIQLSDLSQTHVKTQMLFCHLYLLFRNHKKENGPFSLVILPECLYTDCIEADLNYSAFGCEFK